MESHSRNFPSWEELYQTNDVTNMPWYYPKLDPDVEEALRVLKLSTGKVLDLGTGPGIQALELARRGFKVTALDFSLAAVSRAQKIAEEEGVDVCFMHADVLHLRLRESFDYVLDRGCFHTIEPEQRVRYRSSAAKLVKEGGYFFLKCYSYKEQGETGLYHLHPDELQELFSDVFQILGLKETVYHGTQQPHPQALFALMQRKTLQ